MTKEDIAAMFGGTADTSEERETHSYTIDKKSIEPIIAAVFQENRQVAFSDTLALLSKFHTSDLVPQVAAALGQSVLVYRQMFPLNLSFVFRGVCFTRDGWVIATVIVRAGGVCLGLSLKTLTPFDGGFSVEAVVKVAKDFAEKTRSQESDGMRIWQTPEQVADAIVAAVEKLPKEG